MQTEHSKTKSEQLYDNIQQESTKRKLDSSNKKIKIFWPKQIWKKIVILSAIGVVVAVIIVVPTTVVVVSKSGNHLSFYSRCTYFQSFS